MDLYVVHCGDVLDVYKARTINPTEAEAQRGVVNVQTRVYFCPKEDCRRKVYYKRESFDIGFGEWQRVKKGIAPFIARLKQAQESDWVWSYHPETFSKVKKTVR